MKLINLEFTGAIKVFLSNDNNEGLRKHAVLAGMLPHSPYILSAMFSNRCKFRNCESLMKSDRVRRYAPATTRQAKLSCMPCRGVCRI